VVLTIAIACVGVGAIIGLEGNSKVATGVDAVSNFGKAFVNEMYSMVKMCVDATALAGGSDDSGSDSLTIVQKLRDTVISACDLLLTSNNARAIAAYVFFGIFFVAPFIGVCAYFCGSGKLACVMTQLAFLFIVIGWILFALAFVVGVVLDDTCVQAGVYVYNKPQSLITKQFDCAAGDSLLEAYGMSYTIFELAASNYSQNYPTQPLPTLQSVGLVANATLDSDKYAKNKALMISLYSNFSIPCGMVTTGNPELCYAAGLAPSTYQSMCAFGSGSEPTSQRCLQQQMIFGSSGMVGMAYTISCQYLNSLVQQMNDVICTPMVSGLTRVAAGQFIISFFYIVVITVGCCAVNRFNSLNNESAVTPDSESGMEMNGQVVHYDSMDGSDPNSVSNKYTQQNKYTSEQQAAAVRIQAIARQKEAKKKVATKRNQMRPA